MNKEIEEGLQKTAKQIIAERDKNNCVTGYVSLQISDLIDNDFEEFLDLLSISLVDSDLLMDVTYDVVALDETDKNTLIFKVTGDVSNILECEEDAEGVTMEYINNGTLYSCEINMDSSCRHFAEDGGSFNEFGCAVVYNKQTGIGAEYSLNASSIYLTCPDENGIYKIDHETSLTYQVDFNEDYWGNKLIDVMTNFVHYQGSIMSQKQIAEFKENYRRYIQNQKEKQK